jgi:uncharacterized surface protein with fasciclin (FAS1) repeats
MRKLTTLLASAALLAVATPIVAEAQEKDIVETAVAAGTFNTLAKALEATGLTEVLKGSGPFTVFAPSDEAFAALPAGKLDELMNDKEALKALLLGHVVQGRVSSSEALQMDGKAAATVGGTQATISVADGKVKVNESQVVKADIEASNGVIHVINAVILPVTATPE